MNADLNYPSGWNMVNERFDNESDTPIEWNAKELDENGVYLGEPAMPIDFSETLRSAAFDGSRFAVEVPNVPDGNGGFVSVKVGIVPVEDLEVLNELEYENEC
jgi:hypothetical protein